MTTQEWASISARIAAYWPATKWTTELFAVWYEDLGQFDADVVRTALNELKLQPGAFGPSIGDLMSRIHADPSKPTFDEMFRDLFSTRGALAARGIDGTRRRLEGMHPLVVSFAERQGIQRLKELPVHDQDDGHWRRKELQQAWAAHLEAMAGRDVAALASGRGAGELDRLDPLAALGISDRPALAPGE